MWNAQRNFNVFTSTNLTVGVTNLTLMASQGEQFLTNLFPSHRWMLYAFNSTASAATVSWRCSNCFVSYAPRTNYTLLVFGVSMSDQGNAEALAPINQGSTLDAYSTANSLVEATYAQNACVQGVFSVQNTV
jgi:hypothetical protein